MSRALKLATPEQVGNRQEAANDADTPLLKELARSLNCLTVEDLCVLAGITVTTAEAWRRRGQGPAYAIVGRRVLYPHAAVAKFVAECMRERAAVPAKAVL